MGAIVGTDIEELNDIERRIKTFERKYGISSEGVMGAMLQVPQG